LNIDPNTHTQKRCVWHPRGETEKITQRRRDSQRKATQGGLASSAPAWQKERKPKGAIPSLLRASKSDSATAY
jgi:Zn-finger nucleic acid-binding protein